MRRSHRDRAVGVVALVVVSVLVIVVPVVLIRLAGWPLPTSMPDWERTHRAVNQGDIPADAVLNALAAIVWLIWFQLIWALIWELAVNVPRVTHGRVTRQAPLVPASVGNGIGRLVALILTIGTVVASTPSSVTALPSAPVGAFMPPALTNVSYAGFEREGSPVAAAGGPRWRVERGDSLWRIAETTLGDGDRATEILDDNRWLASPRSLRPGQILVLPADAVVPVERQPERAASAQERAEPPPSENAAQTYLPATQIVIKPGDTLWDLAEQRLAMVDRDVHPGETLGYVNAVVAANPQVVEDPDLIHPGEVFAFPELGTPPPAPQAQPIEIAPVPDPARDAPEPPVTVHTDTEYARPVANTAEPDANIATSSEPLASPAESPVTPTGAPTPIRTERPAAVTQPSSSSTAAPWLAGISGATALASGLLLMYRRRIAARAARGAANYRTAIPDDPKVLTALTRAADVPLIRWANAQLCDVIRNLSPAEVDGQPLAIELSDATGIELLWTAANPKPPAPWQADHNGWTWTLAYDPDAPIDNSHRPSAIPSLVTIGSRDGNQLLLNLEAVGTLSVSGTDQSAASFVRSVVAELSVGDIVGDAYVVACGVDLGGLEGLDRVQFRDIDDTKAKLAAAVEASNSYLRDYSFPTAFATRLGGDATGRETTVVAVDGADVDRFETDVQPGLSVSLVCTGLDHGGSCVRIGDDGKAVLEPHGIDFTPACLPLQTVDCIEELFSDAEPAHVEPTAQPRLIPKPVPAHDERADHLGCNEDDWQLPDPAVLVRVLGAPEVVGSELGRIETSIIVYLACHGGKRRDDQVINAVWNGRLVEPKTLWNKISKIRSVLGVDLVPARPPNSPNVVVSDRVMTDVEILRRLQARTEQVAEAEGLDLLLHGLDLIDGVPFDSAEYDWSYETQDHATACETVEAAALRCVELAMNLGDLVAARHAVTQGLRALPLNEPLYRARMRIEAAGGNTDGVRNALVELTTALGDATSGTLQCGPEAQTLSLAKALTAPA